MNENELTLKVFKWVVLFLLVFGIGANISYKLFGRSFCNAAWGVVSFFLCLPAELPSLFFEVKKSDYDKQIEALKQLDYDEQIKELKQKELL